jgi:hypothetical protein
VRLVKSTEVLDAADRRGEARMEWIARFRERVLCAKLSDVSQG